jgi:hypothetical protein
VLVPIESVTNALDALRIVCDTTTRVEGKGGSKAGPGTGSVSPLMLGEAHVLTK